MTQLIGIASHYPGAGKSTVSMFLTVSLGYYRLPFAQPLKELCCTFLESLGMSESEAAHHVYDWGKEEVVPGLGVTGRHLLQTLGTNWGRHHVAPDIWLRVWHQSYAVTRNTHPRIVVDDVRFPNEAAAIKELGGQVWCVHRTDAIAPPRHESEGALHEWPFDAQLHNDGTLRQLESEVLRLATTQLSC